MCRTLSRHAKTPDKLPLSESSARSRTCNKSTGFAAEQARHLFELADFLTRPRRLKTPDDYRTILTPLCAELVEMDLVYQDRPRRLGPDPHASQFRTRAAWRAVRVCGI